MRRVSIGVILGVLLLLAAPLRAQQGTSSIAGKVTDEQGAILPGVSIVVTNEESGVFREVTSSGEGTYVVSALPPGRYKVMAKLEGFRTLERGGLVLALGTTLTNDLQLRVGGLEETVTVSGQAPLVDTSSVRVGGNINSAELSELPAMNRNYFSAVALLPGVQFNPSTQMGNDTIIAAGQSNQNNNVTVDGGYNADDALGTSAGAQVRTPLEAIQEFQVITSMYDAEFGRAAGAVVNAVTKSGTNNFRGVAFGYTAPNAWTSEDYFVRTRNLEKPTTTKREWGGVLGGPIIQNKAHFFLSLERQVDNPNRTRVFPVQQFDFSEAEDRTDWNTIVRVDHQINANHTWAVRWLREWAPQWYTYGNRQTKESYQDETDLDQTAVGTLTSVVGNAKVNTVRIARTWEHWWHGNECFRAQGGSGDRAGFKFGEEDTGNQALCPPQLDYPAFLAQASTESQGPWDSNYQLEDDYSWFLPGKKGDHDLKFGVRYNYTELRRVSQIQSNGQFRFNSDQVYPFNPADPRTYPERLTIRTDTFNEFIKNHTYEFFAQDKWRIGRNTISVGLRYDLEIIPMDETDNPLFPANDKNYPVDKNNISPRIGFTRSLDAQGKSVIRGGYGIFYNRTILGWVDDAIEFPKFGNSLVLNFPTNAADPGPGRGQLPTDPYLVNGPTVNRTLLNQQYPVGQKSRNDGDVIFDTPNRATPYAHQATFGYTRELAASLAMTADVIYSKNEDMFLATNLNPGLRMDTSRTGTINRSDAFGVLGEPYRSPHVYAIENWGEADYKALNLSVEKRYSNNWSARLSYSLSKAEGTANDQSDKNLYQVLTDLNLDAWKGPSNVDRRHILSLSARTQIPKTFGATLSTTIRYMSGQPFTIFDSNIDADRNGELFDPVPAGTYSGSATDSLQNVEYKGGRNGAYGPDYFQADVRAGWRRPMGGSRTLEVFLDIYNITNRANFDAPSGVPAGASGFGTDRRTPSTYLVLTNLRGGSGFPRQAQLGVRYEF